MRRWTSAALAMVLAAGCALSGAGTADAHAYLERSDPVTGALLAEPPPVVTMEFSEELSPEVTQTTLTRDAAPVALAPPTVTGSTITQPLPADLDYATYHVNYHIVSHDGHTVAGSVWFILRADAPGAGAAGAGTTTAAPPPTISGDAAEQSPAATRGNGVVYVAIGVLVAGAVAVAVFATRALRRRDRRHD